MNLKALTHGLPACAGRSHIAGPRSWLVCHRCNTQVAGRQPKRLRNWQNRCMIAQKGSTHFTSWLVQRLMVTMTGPRSEQPWPPSPRWDGVMGEILQDYHSLSCDWCSYLNTTEEFKLALALARNVLFRTHNCWLCLSHLWPLRVFWTKPVDASHTTTSRPSARASFERWLFECGLWYFGAHGETGCEQSRSTAYLEGYDDQICWTRKEPPP